MIDRRSDELGNTHGRRGEMISDHQSGDDDWDVKVQKVESKVGGTSMEEI